MIGFYIVSALASAANAVWLGNALERLLESLFEGPYGFDALLTARTTFLKIEATLSTGDTSGGVAGVAGSRTVGDGHPALDGRRPRDPVGGRLPTPRGPAGLSAPSSNDFSFSRLQMESRFGTSQRRYANGVHALKDVTLTIPRGMFGLLGPNGAGKSTLMRTIATLQEPDQGSIRFGDIDVLRQKDSVRETLGYLPQEFGVYPNVTAERLLEHFAVLKGITDRRSRREIVDALLHQTNLYEVRKKKLGGYSGGMRQRFGVAVALLGNPKLIIVDEPTAGLDPAERVRFLNLLSELGEDAVVILSTHIVDDVSELCSRLAIIDKGTILLEAEPLQAVAAMRGRIWRRVIEKTELHELERAQSVISTKLLAGRTVVRVHSATSPGAGFDLVEPDLEDVYFSTMAGHYGGRGEQPVLEAAR